MKRTKSRRQTLIVLTIVLFIILAVGVIYAQRNEVRNVLTEAKWYWLAAALGFTFLSYAMLSQGYALLNKVFGVQAPWRDLFEVGIVSSTLNSMLAFSGAVGHSLRLTFVKGPGATGGVVFAASIFHSYLNYVTMLGMMATGIIWLLATQSFHAGGAISLSALGFLVVVSTGISTAIMFVRGLREWTLRVAGKLWHLVTRHDAGGFIREFGGAMEQAMSVLLGRRATMIWVLLIMASSWAFAAAALWFCFLSFGKPPPPDVLLSGFGIGISAGNLSMVPGGLAIQEASMSGVYAALGVSFAQAVLAAIMFRVVYDFIPFFVSLGLYTRLIHSRRQRGG